MKKIFKTAYDILPFKKELFSILKMFWSPSKNIYQHLHFKGNIKVKVNEQSSFLIRHYGYQVENEIFWAGLVNGWEKESIKLWISLCAGCDAILDIGANTGVYSLIAKSINPSAKVYAFEPVARVFSKLQENLSLNGFDVKAYEQAVSDKDGTAVIYDTATDHIYSVTVNKNLADAGTFVKETKIETITLNTFIKNNTIKRIDLIKIDVETHEPEVLEGFSEYLNVFRPTLLIEILNNEVGRKVQELVKDLDYLYFNIDERGSIRQVQTVTASDYYNYLFCNKEIATSLSLL